MIRKFQTTDINQVMQIWLNSNIDAHPFVSREYWESNFDMVKGLLVQAEVYVCEEDDVILGFIGMQEGYIAGIFVSKDCRSKGIGKVLLDYAKTLHQELTLHVYKKNEGAVRFYLREGFSVVNEQIDEATGELEYAMSTKIG